MQTFLPYMNVKRCAKVLDRQRLGKQRVEVLQILKALHEGGGWANHPATRMWRGHEAWLIAYGIAVCREWKLRGYKDTCEEKIAAYGPIFGAEPLFPLPDPPAFLMDPRFREAHQSNLIRKNPEHYRAKFGGDVPDDLEYVWPTGDEP
jgi:hypothetical protein